MSRRDVSVMKSRSNKTVDPKPGDAYQAMQAGQLSASSYYYNAALAQEGPPMLDMSDVKASNEPGWRRVSGKEPNVQEENGFLRLFSSQALPIRPTGCS